jgi:hypothetical protein
MQLLVYYCKQQKLPTDRPLPAEHRAVFNKLCAEYLRRNPQASVAGKSSMCSANTREGRANAENATEGGAALEASDAGAASSLMPVAEASTCGAAEAPADHSSRFPGKAAARMGASHESQRGDGGYRKSWPEQTRQRGFDARSGLSAQGDLDNGRGANEHRGSVDARGTIDACGDRGCVHENAWPAASSSKPKPPPTVRNGELQTASAPRPAPIPGYKHLQGITHGGGASWPGATGGRPVMGSVEYGMPAPATNMYVPPQQWAPTVGHLVVQGGHRSLGGSPMAGGAIGATPEAPMFAAPYDSRAAGLQALYAPLQIGQAAAGGFSGAVVGPGGGFAGAEMGGVHVGYGAYMHAQPHLQLQRGDGLVACMPAQQVGAPALHHVNQHEQPSQMLHWHGTQQ